MELHVKEFGDKHQFTFLSNGPEEGDRLSCGLCGVSIWNGDPAYSCRGCNYCLHKSCLEFPPRMVHPFHPQHSLLLSKAPYYKSGIYFCDACGNKSSDLAFRCFKCDFDLDLECASFRVIKSTDTAATTTTITTTEISRDQLSSGNGHPHPLLGCEKDNKITYLPCAYCNLSVKGSFYVCLECKVLLDQRCAQLPMEIQNHPFHPQHPLSLSQNRGRISGRINSFRCFACGWNKYEQFAYKCSECKFYLDVECASLTVIKPTMTTTAIAISEEEKSHIQLASTSHPHPLFLCSKDNSLSHLYCSYCELSIKSSLVFVCIECELLLHPTCAEFPLEINHPFHPQHPLLIKRTSFRCSACQGNFYQREHWAYHCSDCNFILDIGCASLIVTSITEIFNDGRSQIQLPSSGHPHPLFLCTTQCNELPNLPCPYCVLSIKGSSIFVCLECHLMMHPACAEFPMEINHPFHPQHPLSFQFRNLYYPCSACSFNMESRGYVCTVCWEFGLHVDCSSLMPTNILSKSCSGVSYQQFQLQQHQLRHPHPLTLCVNEKNHQFKCHACIKPFKVEDDDEEEDSSSIYACFECEILLHKSCADLPREIMHHPFHPTHVLKLDDKPRLTECHVCKGYREGSFYVCDSHTVKPDFTKPCGYAAHATCIWPIPRTTKFDFHKHPLAVFDIEDREVHGNSCKKCRKWCTPPYFKCGECKYNLHLSCSPILPLNINHEDHMHSLTLTTSRVGDQDEDIEFFCDTCKESIDEPDRSYSCTECFNYDVHIKCASSAIIINLLNVEESGASAHGDATSDLSS